jgi:hypothetical protein
VAAVARHCATKCVGYNRADNIGTSSLTDQLECNLMAPRY